MSILIFIVVACLVIGFLVGRASKSEYTYHDRSPDDKVVDAMLFQEARNYFNNPVVKELQREFREKDSRKP